MNITLQAQKLIQLNSKKWLYEKLGISKNTLEKRLKDDLWKKSEIQLIIILSKKYNYENNKI